MAIITRQAKGDLLTHAELDGNFTTLDSKIVAEESARINADNVLQSNIDNEESARIDAYTTLQTNIDGVDTRVSTLESQPGYTPPTDQGDDKYLSGDGNYKTIDLSSKQDTLVSGTNIKTINGTSVLGSGDITIEASSEDALTSNDVVTSLYGATGDIDLDKPLFITSSPETIPDNTEIKVIQTFRHDHAGTKYGGNFTYLTNSNKLYVNRGQYSAQLSYTPSGLFNLFVKNPGSSYEYVTFVISGQNNVDIYDHYGSLKTTLDLSQYYFNGGIRSISATYISDDLYVVFCFVGKIVLYSGWDISGLSFNSELSDPDNQTNGTFGCKSMFINDKFVVSNYNKDAGKGKIYVFNVGWGGLEYHTSLTSPSTHEKTFGGDLLTDELETSLFVLGLDYIYKINPSTFQIVKQKKYTSTAQFFPNTVMKSYQPYCDGKNIFIACRFFNGNKTIMYDYDLNYIQTFSDDFVIGKNIILTGLKTMNVKKMIYLVKEAKLGKPPVVTSPNGSQFKISVNDSGDITTSPYQPLIFNKLDYSYPNHNIYYDWEKTFSIDNTSMSGFEGNSLTSLDNPGLAIIVEIEYKGSFVVAFESKIISVDISAGVLNMNIPDEVVDMFNYYISVKGHTLSDDNFTFRIYEKVSNMEIEDTYNVGLIS